MQGRSVEAVRAAVEEELLPEDFSTSDDTTAPQKTGGAQHRSDAAATLTAPVLFDLDTLNSTVERDDGLPPPRPQKQTLLPPPTPPPPPPPQVSQGGGGPMHIPIPVLVISKVKEEEKVDSPAVVPESPESVSSVQTQACALPTAVVPLTLPDLEEGTVKLLPAPPPRPVVPAKCEVEGDGLLVPERLLHTATFASVAENADDVSQQLRLRFLLGYEQEDELLSNEENVSPTYSAHHTTPPPVYRVQNVAPLPRKRREPASVPLDHEAKSRAVAALDTVVDDYILGLETPSTEEEPPRWRALQLPREKRMYSPEPKPNWLAECPFEGTQEEAVQDLEGLREEWERGLGHDFVDGRDVERVEGELSPAEAARPVEGLARLFEDNLRSHTQFIREQSMRRYQQRQTVFEETPVQGADAGGGQSRAREEGEAGHNSSLASQSQSQSQLGKEAPCRTVSSSVPRSSNYVVATWPFSRVA